VIPEIPIEKKASQSPSPPRFNAFSVAKKS